MSQITSSLRKIAGRALSVHPSMARLTARIAIDDRLIPYLFADPRLPLRLSSDASLMREFLALVGDDRLLGAILDDPLLSERIYLSEPARRQLQSNPRVRHFLLNDPSVLEFVSGSREIAARLAGDAQWRELIFAEQPFRDWAARDERLLKLMLERDSTIDTLAQADHVFSRMLSLESSYAKLLTDDELIGRLFREPCVIDRWLKTPEWPALAMAELLRSLEEEPSSLDDLLQNATLADRFYASELVRHRIRADKKLFIELASSDDGLAEIIADKSLLTRILAGGGLDAVLTHESFLDRIVNDSRAFERLLANDDLVLKLLWNEKVLARLLASEVLLFKILSSERVWLKILGDDQFLTRLIDNERVFGKILADEPMLTRVLSSSRAFDKILSDDQFLTKILSSERAFGKILADDQMLTRVLSSGRALDKILSDDQILTKLLSSERVFGKILADETMLTRVVSNGRTLEKILSDDGLLTSFISNERVFSKLLADETMLTRVVSNGRALEKILSDDGLLTKLITHERVFGKILADETMLTRVVSNGRALEKILSDDGLLTKLISHERVFGKILADDQMVTRVVSNGRALEKILCDDGLLTKLISHERVFGKILADEQMITKLLSHGRALEKILSNTQLFATFLGNERAMKNILADPSLTVRLLDQPRLAELIRQNGSLLGRIASNETIATAAIADPALFPNGAVGTMVQAHAEFRRVWRELEPFIDTNREGLSERLRNSLQTLTKPEEIQDRLLDIICEDGKVYLKGASLAFTDRFSLWTELNEILLDEDYYFETASPEPRILDCGTNFGLALYYFKRLYPNARITGFEPVPSLHRMAKDNAMQNDMADVTVHPWAISETSGKSTFYESKTFPMAGSLTERRKTFGDQLSELCVTCKPLSQFLNEPVHFLKLDIEGSEDAVLAEAAAKLHMVENIFIEYHHGAGSANGRLETILNILDRAEFDWQLGKSFHFGRQTRRRALTFSGRPFSLNIWAKNKNEK